MLDPVGPGADVRRRPPKLLKTGSPRGVERARWPFAMTIMRATEAVPDVGGVERVASETQLPDSVFHYR